MKGIERLARQGHPVDGLTALGHSFPEAVASGDPHEAAHVFYDAKIEQATVGIWESGAGTVRFAAYPFDELCLLVEGELTLLGTDGVETFRAGDVFIVREKWAGDWIMHRPLRKFYAELKK